MLTVFGKVELLEELVGHAFSTQSRVTSVTKAVAGVSIHAWKVSIPVGGDLH
jgi:hypothetical protein